MHADDLASACIFLMERHRACDIGELVNIGTGVDLTIRELAELVKRVVGFDGALSFDASKPDGTPRKLLDISLLSRLGWRAQVALEDGIARSYADFLNRSASVEITA
jgi:GDP-L-fucose synthase